MNTTQQPDPSRSPERKPTPTHRDDDKKHPGQAKPDHPDRQDDRDNGRDTPQKK